jgi:pimeloyl-ACP methyl ester carboxylesterase
LTAHGDANLALTRSDKTMNQVLGRRASLRSPAARPRREAGGDRGKPVLIGAAVAVLGVAAIANHLVAKRSERRHPPRGKFLNVDGVRLHYLERGEGPTIVLIHGNGVTASDYELSGLIGRLSQQHRVIAFDRPGFGYSARPRRRSWTAKDQAKLLLAALDAVGVDAAIIVAHSWGTLVALQTALERPERVHALVLMSGYYWPTPRLDVPLLSGPAVPGFGDLLRFTISPPLGWAMTPMVMKQMFSPSKVPLHFRTGFETSIMLRPWQIRAAAADTAMMPFEASQSAARHREVQAPVLVITGDGDKIVSFKHQSRRLARELPEGQILVVQGAGHMVHHTAPDEVGSAIEEFIQQIAMGRTSLATSAQDDASACAAG